MTVRERSTEHTSRKRMGRHAVACNHDYPILVTRFDDGRRRARCLGCGAVGAACATSEDARLALLATNSL